MENLVVVEREELDADAFVVEEIDSDALPDFPLLMQSEYAINGG